MLHGRRSLPKYNIVSFSRYKRGDNSSGITDYNKEGTNVEYLNEELKYLKFRLGLGGKDNATFCFITDIHPNVLSSGTTQWGWNPIYKNFSIFEKTSRKIANRYVYNSIEQMDGLEQSTGILLKLRETQRIDCCILGGDYGGNDYSTSPPRPLPKQQFLKILGGQSEIMGKISRNIPTMVCKGNHDSNAFNTSDNTPSGRSLNMISSDAYVNGDPNLFPTPDFSENEYKKHCINAFLSFSSNVIYGDSNKTYGYYDITDKKIRIAFFNIYELPFTSQYDAGKRDNWFMTETQLGWIINNIFNFDSNQTGWKIIICCHNPIIHNAERENSIQKSYGDQVFKMLVGFQHKLSGTITTTIDSQYQINVSYDFRNIDSTNKILCTIHGHYHASALSLGFYYYNKDATNLSNKYHKNNNQYTAIGTFQGIDLENRYYISGYNSNNQPVYATDSSNRYYITSIGIDATLRKVAMRKTIFDVIQLDLSNNKIWCHHCGNGKSRRLSINSNGIFSEDTKNIEVTILDGSQPVSNATITLKLNGGFESGTTNASGIYTFTNVPIDKCVIEVTAEGYQDYVEPIDNINLTNKPITLTRNE